MSRTPPPHGACGCRYEKFVIQYAHGYAVFNKLGVRSDHLGQAPLVLDGIRMYCAGNHFW